MSAISFKAKVLIKPEEQMDLEMGYDLGNVARDPKLVWTEVGYPVDEIYHLAAYSKTKTVVTLYDEQKILVMEPFEDLFKRWNDLLKNKDNKEEDIAQDLEKEADKDEDED